MEPLQKQRLVSLDTYRGLTLALLCLEATNYDWVHTIAHAYPKSGFWAFMEHHFSHVAWAGAGLVGHDPAVLYVHGRRVDGLLLRQTPARGRFPRPECFAIRFGGR